MCRRQTGGDDDDGPSRSGRLEGRWDAQHVVGPHSRWNSPNNDMVGLSQRMHGLFVGLDGYCCDTSSMGPSCTPCSASKGCTNCKWEGVRVLLSLSIVCGFVGLH